MKVQRTPAEREQIKNNLQNDQSFIKVFKNNWTEKVMEDLSYKLYGKIPRNFLVNISGHIGTPTGIFKSTLGLQIALKLDPLFNLNQRVAFSINQLLDKVKSNSEYHLCNKCYYDFKKTYRGTYELYKEEEPNYKCDNCDNLSDNLVLLTKMVFFLDEQTRTLKTGGLTRLKNLIDTVRQRQICIITCGVDQYNMSFTTYNLKRIQESSDEYLPKKTVRYGVYDDERGYWYGYFQWNITPLTDPFWNRFWEKYSRMKTKFQRVAISQQIQSVNFEEYAQRIIALDDFLKCFKTTKKGDTNMQTGMVRNLIYKHYPDLTQEERDYILSEIKFEIYDETEEQ